MAALPREIWETVFAYLDRPEFRSLRLLNKELNHLCTPRLYQVLNLYSTLSSLEHAQSISNTPSLACLVSRLNLVEERTDICHSFHSFENRIQAIWGPKDRPDHISRKIIHDERVYSAHVLSGGPWITDHVCETLSSLVSLLPNLEQISRCQLECTENLIAYRDAEKTLRDIYRLEWDLHQETFFFGNMCELLLKKPTKRLELNPVHIAEIARPLGLIATSTFQETPALQNLTELKLVLAAEQRLPSFDSEEFRLECLQRFLASAPNLQQLEFSFLQLYTGTRSPFLIHSICKLVLQYPCSQIRSMNLSNISCTETDIVTFVKKHVLTLESLTLRNLGLYLEVPQISRRHNSALRLCWDIKHQANLRHFSIGGEVTTVSREAWNIATNTGSVADIRPESISSTSIITQLCESVCGRAVFPFPPVHMRNSDEPLTEDIENMVMLINEYLPVEDIKEQFQDESFRWIGCSSLVKSLW